MHEPPWIPKSFGIGSAAAATGAIALLDPELWTPTRTFFLPPVGGWAGGNRLLTMAQITNEALRILHHEMVLATKFYEGDQWSPAQLAQRGTVNVCRPPRYAFQALNQIVHEWQT